MLVMEHTGCSNYGYPGNQWAAELVESDEEMTLTAKILDAVPQ